MDKLRAIEYFIRAVEVGSFAGAARLLDVSKPAVTQLVAELERSLGITLLQRSARGLTLTTDGERYYETSRKLTAGLQDIEQRLGPRGAKPRGMLRVGLRPLVAERCVLPRIGRFLSRFPDVELSMKLVGTMQDVNEESLDVAVLVGWPPTRDLVVRHLFQTRHVVCASPDYWMREGKPQDPDALRAHECLVVRSITGVILDRWTFKKDGEQRTVDVKSRLCTDDRTWLEAAACGGAGVVRFTDLALSRVLSLGLLVPVLHDWEAQEAPTVFVAYWRSQRNSKLVQVFVDFLFEIFAEMERERAAVLTNGVPRVSTPEWYPFAHGRRSTYVGRGKKAAAS